MRVDDPRPVPKDLADLGPDIFAGTEWLWYGSACSLVAVNELIQSIAMCKCVGREVSRTLAAKCSIHEGQKCGLRIIRDPK